MQDNLQVQKPIISYQPVLKQALNFGDGKLWETFKLDNTTGCAYCCSKVAFVPAVQQHRIKQIRLEYVLFKRRL